MRRALALTALPLVAMLAACGQQTGRADSSGPAPSQAESTAGQWGDCTVAAFEDAGPELATVHLGSEPVPVKLPESGPCAGGFVALVPGGVIGTDVADLALEPDTLQVLDAGDLAGRVLVRVDGGVHPRGGFQPHLFVVGDDVTEATVDGAPLVPFVATDGGMAPMGVRCGDGSVSVLTARTSEPPGVVLAWDVERTTYDLSGAHVRRTATEQVRDHAADPLLRRDMPELFDPLSPFAGC